jgi:hypothetical protein
VVRYQNLPSNGNIEITVDASIQSDDLLDGIVRTVRAVEAEIAAVMSGNPAPKPAT